MTMQHWIGITRRFVIVLLLSLFFIGVPGIFRDHLLHGVWWGQSLALHPSTTLFLSIVLEAMPFIVVGVMVSSFIHLLVPAEKMARLLPRKGFGSILAASLLGLIIPVCDCGTIPVARSLCAKGVPDGPVLTFVLSAAVLNPVSLWATYVALGWHFTVLRAVATFAIAIICGSLVGERSHLVGAISALQERADFRSQNGWHRLTRLFSPSGAEVFVSHATREWFLVSGFVVISAIAAVLAHQHVQWLTVLQGTSHGAWSIILLMIAGILLSLCSEADAFVARGFLLSFPVGSVFSFLLIGQLADVRNLLLLPKVFSRRIVVQTVAICILITFMLGYGLSALYERGVHL